MFEFTPGQASRMLNAWNAFRATWRSENRR
jgi:hypothetical protein